MHLCFVDESGTPSKPEKIRHRYFVIAGVIIPEERWHRVSDQLHGLKTRLHYRGELKWRYFAPNNNDADNPMADWSVGARNDVRNEAFSILTKDRSIRVVAGICEAATAYKLRNVNSQDDLYFGTYKVVAERFQYLLQDISRTGGRSICGIIVADHRGRSDDARMRSQHQRLVNEEMQYSSTFSRLIEGIFLTPSHLSVGIQFADLVAGAIWRRFEVGDATWYDKIAPAIRTDPAGQTVDGYGLARFPKRGWAGPIP